MAQMDALYARPESDWSAEPNGLCRRVCALLDADGARGGRAMSIRGADEGRDAVAFARHGLTVTAVDAPLPGRRKAEAWAAAEGMRGEPLAADILRPRMDRDCRLVDSSGAVHYLPPRLRAEIFANCKAPTEVGGYNARNVFAEKPFIATPADYGPDRYFFRSGELLGLYWDWEVVHFEEEVFACTSGGVPHRHAMDTPTARKVLP